LGEIVSEITMGPGSWCVIEADEARHADLGESVHDELRFAPDLEGAVLESVVPFDGSGVDLVRLLSRTSACAVVISLTKEGIARCGPWLDEARTRFIDGPTVILLLPTGGCDLLAHAAPNLMSWIGSYIWSDPSEFPPTNQEERLKHLREHLKLSDAEVIRLAEAAELPLDPVFAEWLTMLGRGDLLGS
jgi:hypothetical protein